MSDDTVFLMNIFILFMIAYGWILVLAVLEWIVHSHFIRRVVSRLWRSITFYKDFIL